MSIFKYPYSMRYLLTFEEEVVYPEIPVQMQTKYGDLVPILLPCQIMPDICLKRHRLNAITKCMVLAVVQNFGNQP
ncbi:MAG: hypothetical protein ACE5J9_06895 [Methanosarcinales archaeon]